MLRNNQASAVHIISVVMEEAPYICTICSYSILRPREHSNQTSSASTENKAQLIPSVSLLFPFLNAIYRKNIFLKYSLQILIFRFFCGVYLHKQWKVILIPCSISPGSVKGSMFVFLSWRVACLNKTYANELEVLHVLLNASEKQKFKNLNYFP